MEPNETIQYDCFRGCTITDGNAAERDIRYRPGCCKLQVYDYLKGISQEQFNSLFEVRFKNTRKGIYLNTSGQSVKTGDLVVVEAATGHARASIRRRRSSRESTARPNPMTSSAGRKPLPGSRRP